MSYCGVLPSGNGTGIKHLCPTIPAGALADQPPIPPAKTADERTPVPLQGPRLAQPEYLPHQQAQVVGRHLKQIPFGHVFQTPQPRPPTPACFADVSKAPLYQLTPFLLEPLA